jgi:energy-coupling factor transporter ATP-binding protein EcfA2
MRITRLTITNLRAMQRAEFHLRSGFNLIVGVNGVGKSTVLDALRICMSRILPMISDSQARAISFGAEDIRRELPFMEVEVVFELGGQEFRLTRRQWKERIAADDKANLERLRREILETERLRDRARNLLRELDDSQTVEDTDVFSPSKVGLSRAAKALAIPPNCVFFSTNRSVVAAKSASKRKAAGRTAAAYAEALLPRSWQVKEFAAWMQVQRALAEESSEAARHLEVLEAAATRFLPAYGLIRPSNAGSGLLIDKGGVTLDVSQLSDGERGVLGMVLDLARRLSQANPSLDDPLRKAEAIVLIDELDLHLHPSWQRQIVHKLSEVFPGCQFIATSHSPQIIGEVEHDRIQIIADGQVHSPPRSFGMDSSRVLEEIMEADPRAHEVKDLLTQFSQQVGKLRFDRARELLAQLVMRLGENDPDVTRARTLIDFVEGKE